MSTPALKAAKTRKKSSNPILGDSRNWNTKRGGEDVDRKQKREGMKGWGKGGEAATVN